MSIRQIDSNFHVTGQISPDQIAPLVKAGYKTVICMRPDKEGFRQPEFAAVAAAAKAAGLDCHHIPVRPGAVTPEQVAQLKAILDRQMGPILAFCASGNRCASAYQMAKSA